MIKSFRFLLQFALVNLGILIGFAVVVTLGAYATGVPAGLPAGSGNLFQTYFSCFPLMMLLIIYMYTFALCTSCLNLGLSMGGRRRDFFWAIQGILLLYAAVCWAIQLLMSALPWLGNWNEPGRWSSLMSFGGRLWVFPALCVMLGVLGCISGLIFARSKVWGTIIIVVAMLLGIVGVAVLLLNGEFGFFEHGPWAVLPAALLGVTAAAAVIGETVMWRTVYRFIVR